jgi:hypothetical protein
VSDTRTPTDDALAKLLPRLERGIPEVEMLIEALRNARHEYDIHNRYCHLEYPCPGVLTGGIRCLNGTLYEGERCSICQHIYYLAEKLGALSNPLPLDPAEYQNVEYRRGWEDHEEAVNRVLNSRQRSSEGGA